jgi:hypothetical protein
VPEKWLGVRHLALILGRAQGQVNEPKFLLSNPLFDRS